MQKLKNILKHWLVVALLTTAFCGLAYLTVQQTLRLGANDPQIQMAEDIASAREKDTTASSLLPQDKVDLQHSLGVFVIIFDDQGNQIASSGVLNGQSPQLPGGVLEYVRQHGEDRLTWQPEGGVRIAAVVTRVNGVESGFVLVGRSLREVERRISQIELICGLTWLATLGLASVVIAAGEFLLSAS
jgi:hypothetical protein